MAMQTRADRMTLSHVSTLDAKIAPVAVTVETVRQPVSVADHLSAFCSA